MDNLLVWSLLLVLGVVSYFSLLFFNLRTLKIKRNIIEPPGSTGWPLIGESLKFVSAGKDGKPESFFRERMMKYSPDVFKTSIAGHKMVVLCGPGGHKMAFSNDRDVIRIWWPSMIKNIMVSKGSSLNEEGKMRDLLFNFLKPEALRDYMPIMGEMMKKYMDTEFVTDQVILAFPLSKKLAFSLSCKLFMNIEDLALTDKLRSHFAIATAGLLSAPINLPGTSHNRAIKAANKFREELFPVIKQRRIEYQQHISNGTVGKQDFMSFLVAVLTPDDENMLLKEVSDAILTVLMASHDTTSVVMAYIVFFLADHPHVYNQVLQEQHEISKCKQAGDVLNWDDVNKMKYSRRVINEVMRLAPPAPGAFRQATSDFTYGGFTIPKGRKIFWSVHSTHKDPKYFENPEEFNPSRFEGTGPAPYTFVPFGAGPYMCPGNEFARVEILIFMHNMVSRFRWEKIAENEKIIYSPIPTPAQGIPVRLMMHDN